MLERRHTGRRELSRIGELHLDRTSYPLGCLVLDASETGALIEVGCSEMIPDQFRLTVLGDGLDHRCEVVRRKRHTLGVAFTDLSSR